MSETSFLDDVCQDLQTEFETTRRVLSFAEYLDLVRGEPRGQLRGAPQYLRDCFDHFGKEPADPATGRGPRYRLFDAPWDEGRDRVVGQEPAQEALYRIIEGFALQRRVNKLVLLHGPNGSAKSSMLACLGRALEAYSRTDGGALYCFSWIFPSDKIGSRRLGFGEEVGSASQDGSSFAGLGDEKVDARIPGDLRDHPLLILPIRHRERLFKELAEKAGKEFLIPASLQRGELSPRNQQIAERLFASYRGDLKKLLRHVQVERFFISRRFRRGTVTVEPQVHVDASVRQLTGDRSLASLPLVLQSTTLYEPFGDLVDAHRGLLEFNDLLKRPIESFKYLLATCEKSTVALPNQILHLDILFVGSSNELHLNAFKEHHDWPSFKGRLELVRVPYLRSYRLEQHIYDDQIRTDRLQKPVAPHATLVAALWAVLTRLRKPNPELYPKDARPLIAALTPLQKADLYAFGRAPAGMPIEKARLLRAQIGILSGEERPDGEYEGQTGASPREMKGALLSAAQRPDFNRVSPLAVLAEIRDLCRQSTLYAFLKFEQEGAYRDPLGFVDVVRGRWLDLATDDLTRALGLITPEQVDDLFRRYLLHVSHEGRGEKIMNPTTGRLEEPDAVLMREMERDLAIDKEPKEFRRDLLGRVGAASQRGPVKPSDYREIFPQVFEKLEGAYYARQKPAIRKQGFDMLKVLAGEGETLNESDRRRAKENLTRLEADFRYDDVSAKETLAALIAERFPEG
ncbi:MAG: serine protein kinase PrkA [Myxococcales bacterium]|nr:serine protein kinase PrkA [Myxococcales bacterium]